MKKYSVYLLLIVFHALISIMMAGCEKGSFELFKSDYSDYLPEIKTLSIEPFSNDSAMVIVELISEGASYIDITGICYSKNPFPTVSDSSVFGAPSGKGQYFLKVGSLHMHDTLYFRSFANNKYGFTYGNIIQYIVGGSGAPDVPCTLADNTILFGSDLLTVQHASIVKNNDYGQQKGYELSVRIDPYQLTLFFMQKPTNGIFTVNNSNFTSNDYNVKGYCLAGQKFWLEDNCKIYISDSLGNYSISICDANTISSSSMEVSLKGNIKFKD